MTDPVDRLRANEELIRRLAAAIRAEQLYAPGHPLVGRAVAALADLVEALAAEASPVAIGLIDQALIVRDAALPRAAEQYGELLRRLQALGIERLAIERGVTRDELAALVAALAATERPGAAPAEDRLAGLAALPHVRVGRIGLGEAGAATSTDVPTIRRLYQEAVGTAERLWGAAQHEGQPDPGEARLLVDDLAQAVAQNRTALVALTALRRYDNYTFTHMVNVSILAMAQARSLGIDGALLREFGLAALMHDIGKVRTPAEILGKPDRLTDAELAVMQLHVVDGAAILRRTPEMPTLAPIVAFEHHLRLDGTGYPAGVARHRLNLGTMLCSIADVYDAMRSQRAYQEAFPSDRILAVLTRNDGTHFDQHLVRRFSQLMGIYPPGNLVALDTGELAVVTRAYAPDPYRPAVRVIADADGRRLDRPRDVNLWEAGTEAPGPRSVRAPLDPAAHDLDPLTFL